MLKNATILRRGFHLRQGFGGRDGWHRPHVLYVRSGASLPTALLEAFLSILLSALCDFTDYQMIRSGDLKEFFNRLYIDFMGNVNQNAEFLYDFQQKVEI